MSELPLSLYIHFPWCIRKCPYCDFNSHAAKGKLPEKAYVDALLSDLSFELSRLSMPRSIESIFIGGGTPSLFSPVAVERLLDGIARRVALSASCEITLEANPGTFESAKFRAFRQLGINRLSIGIQSFNDGHLQRLGRVHSGQEARQAIAIAHEAGFDNLNLDLMFGLPEQTLEQALADVECAIALEPTHFSFYQLTLEPNTYFHRYPPALPDDESIYHLQRQCQQVLATAGYQQYEVSAYARRGYQCRHNRNYWQFGDYLGIGAGAHGKLSLALPDQILRTTKLKNPEHYLQNPTQTDCDAVAIEQLPLEFLMNRLRLKQGFAIDEFISRTGLEKSALEPGLTQSIEQGLLCKQSDHYVCSEQGWDFLDQILEKFVPL